MNPPSGPDEQLLDELRELFSGTTPPGGVVEAAKQSYGWRDVDAEVAKLTGDSALDQPTVQARPAADRRVLTFEARDLLIEVKVVTARRRRRLLGRLVPPQRARVDVSQPDGRLTVEADAAGRFTVAGLEARPVSLRCQLSGRRPVTTEWVLL